MVWRDKAMKRYETPAVEVTKFDVEEIMLASGIKDGEDSDLGFGELM